MQLHTINRRAERPKNTAFGTRAWTRTRTRRVASRANRRQATHNNLIYLTYNSRQLNAQHNRMRYNEQYSGRIRARVRALRHHSARARACACVCECVPVGHNEPRKAVCRACVRVCVSARVVVPGHRPGGRRRPVTNTQFTTFPTSGRMRAPARTHTHTHSHMHRHARTHARAQARAK